MKEQTQALEHASVKQYCKALRVPMIGAHFVHHHFKSKVGHPAISAVHQTAREILQELVNNNVLYIGYGDAEGFPWFTITEYGKQCVNDGNLLPFDPDGYLVALASRVPGLDAIALTYLREAISTYNRGFYLSSAVSLGVAAETSAPATDRCLCERSCRPRQEGSGAEEIRGKVHLHSVLAIQKGVVCIEGKHPG
jgi:hypothetical protein